MIMARNEDGTYSQVGFVKDNIGIDTEYIYDKDGDIVFEKGFTRETSGTVPLTINGIGKDLKAWSITGNTVQNGTPTPENPVEVQAVGERTGNLLNLNRTYSRTFTTDTTKWMNGAATLNAVGDVYAETEILGDVIKVTSKNPGYGASFLIEASPNTTYTVSFETDKASSGSWGAISDRDINGTVIRASVIQGKSATFTTHDNCAFLNVCFRFPPSDGTVTFSNIMLNAGTEPLPYEPYGYKIPVVARGKNLLEPIGFSAQGIANINDYREKTNNVGTSLSTVYGGSVLVTQANQSGNTTSYTNGYFYIAVDFSKFTTGKNYTLSFDYEIKEKHSELVNSIAYIGKATNFVTIDGDWGKDGRKSVTFTVKEGFNPYIEIRLCGNSIFVSNIQIEEGTTATPYEPYHEPITTPIYLDSPLYKIGDYADSLSKTEEVRVVKELVLTGKESWYYMPNYDVENTVRIHSLEILLDRKATMLDLCSHFERMDYSSLNVANKPAFSIANGTQLVFRVSKAEGSMVTYFKDYLAAQYAAGTPVKVYYVVQTPETKTVEPVEIPTLNGTTVIDVDTAVKPTEMYTKYKSSK